MKYEWIDKYLLKKNGTQKDLQPEWNWIRYKLCDKMYAAICLGDDNMPVYITLKLEAPEGEFMREQYEDIIPGYYMNKTHWNSVRADGNVPDEVLKTMLDKSYELILHSFSKKKQNEIFTQQKK